jgi:hypothetical protein
MLPGIAEEIVVRIIFMAVQLVADKLQIILKNISKYSQIPLISIC